ncbi:sulfite exporter TauE/SafE family protein [Pelagibius sp.]|uniref:sulfite exporter TauE/SafE family protein n=1 Tax=Pelagibius sp. TaxID=1931238 RepID=UPI00263A24E6|nr:sulfite exporter TauE/SafE family protein [Pelagibius sp.]
MIAGMWGLDLIAVVVASFLLAGLVKGLVGLGLPTVALALLATQLDLKAAIPLVLVPSLATNIWQAVSGGALAALLKRLWPLLAVACLGIWFGAGLLAGLDAKLLSGLFGTILCVYALVSVARAQVPAPGRWERWLSPLVGAVNGLITGLTGSFIFPSVLYLQALGLPRDQLIQAMGLTFLVSTLAMAVALAGHTLLPAEAGLLSGFALIPALAGMALGQRFRKTLPEERFRRLFFLALAALGAYLAWAAFLQPGI